MRGRPKRNPLDKIKARAWFAAIKQKSGCTSTYAINNLFDVVEDKRFEKYARGVLSPNPKTQKLVNKKLPGTRAVYKIGPDSPSGNAPLWIALAGSMEQVWEELVKFDPEFHVMRFWGAGNSARVNRIKDAIIPLATIIPQDTFRPKGEPTLTDTNIYAQSTVGDYPMNYIDWQNGRELNVFERLYEMGVFTVSMDQLAAVIAMWRLSMFVGEGKMEMRYLLRGLMPKALKDLLGPYDVDEDVREYIEKMEESDISTYKLPIREPTPTPSY